MCHNDACPVELRIVPMADNSDFMALYDELGVGADCSMEQLTRTWRRRVRQLHPDRGAAGEHAAASLQLLNARFREVRRFHRQHGRMPGSRVNGGNSRATHAMVPPRRQPETGRHHRTSLWLITPLALLLLWFSARADSLPAGVVPSNTPANGWLQP